MKTSSNPNKSVSHSFLLPPLPVPLGKSSLQISDLSLLGRTTSKTLPYSGNMNSSLHLECIFSYEPQLGKPEESNNQGIEVNRSKSYAFLSQQKTLIKHTGSALTFLQTPMQMCRRVSIPYFKINVLFFLFPPLFWRIYQPSGQDQQNGKRKQCQLLRLSFKMNSQDTFFHISVNSLGPCFSPDFLLHFF